MEITPKDVYSRNTDLSFDGLRIPSNIEGLPVLLSIYPSNGSATLTMYQLFLRQLTDANLSKMGIIFYLPFVALICGAKYGGPEEI